MIKRKLIYLEAGIILILLIGGISFVMGLTANRWNPDSVINASLSDIGVRLKLSVFYKDSSWYSIGGNESGNFFGFKWDGTAWERNQTINASLPDIGAYSAPAVFYKDSSWYLISGGVDGKFYGYAWNGTQWLTNTTINASLPTLSGGDSTPSVFYKDSSWYLISGSYNGRFYGYAWNGTQWKVNTTINASLPDIGVASAPAVFYKDSSWYLISGNYYGNFYGFNWNGTQWLENLTIIHLLPDTGAYSAPAVFYKDSSWYLISGTSSENLYGFNWTTEAIPPTYNSSTIGVNTTLAGELAKFYVDISDGAGLGGFYFEHNNTGIWQNETFKTFSELSETNYTYYFRNISPTHGQSSGTDVGVLVNEIPTTNETVTCGTWIMYWFDEEENLTDWHISKIYFHVYYNSSSTTRIGYQLEGTYNLEALELRSIPTTSGYELYESTWGGVDYLSPNDISNKSLFAIKLTGSNPTILSGPGMQSYIIITGGVPTTQANYALKLNDTAGSTIGYRWYFNDMSNNWNSTDMSFLTTSESVSPNVTIVSPTSGQIFSSSRVSFELITDEDSTCNYSVNAGAINSSMTANSTGTGHTNSATLGNGDYTINYYCADIFGNLNNTENVSFRVSVSSSPSVSSGGSGIFKPTRKQLEEGYEKILNKEQIIQINLSNGEIYTVGIKEVNRIEGKVIFGVDGKNYSIVENSFEKIALDNDGYYDLQISVVQVYETGYSKIEFKEIHEEIPAEGEEAVIGKVVENNENIVSDKYNIIYYVFGFVVLVLIVSIVFRKFKQKKER